MLTSSSPTISAPPSPSPSVPFRSHDRNYHASRRTSTSSAASPRFQVTSSRRAHHPHTSSAQSPVPAFARSPHTKKREYQYTDSGTQYTPPGFPPTYRAPLQESTVHSVPLPATAIARPERGETSANAAVTEPREPELRVDPQPVVLTQNAQPGRKTPREGEGDAQRGQQRERPDEAGAASQDQASPAKRPRSLNQHVKVMPLKYETCDVKDLGILISDMLMELVRLNDEMPLRDGQLTRFHSRAPPAISVKDYLFRLIVHATLSPPILLSMVFYVDKLCTMYSAFTISSLTVHRFLITAATVAAKGLSDSFWTNSLYAKVGGVSLRELALLELEFLRKLDWRIVPKPETLVDYYKGLVERGEGYVMEPDPDPAPTATHLTAIKRAESSAPVANTREPANS
ncbi:cyclin-domain-containing protein [Lentithecium fluviatile CBS 122367]|uniref:Cyclin-domain-containing protein n=1 Tax=Lentithecium fluviatile CBS 122367 TaxID=1168545 RepID=A0A6G1JE31_9PLEO|nr:cyclin-domain-containing protein [Lentithecium fluviatile CBS 122367]